jgi:hypothetical protein
MTTTLDLIRGLSNGSLGSDLALVGETAQLSLARTYDALPELDESALPAWRKMADETADQAALLRGAGFRFEVVESDPYPDAHAMLADVIENRRIKVLSTESTGGHPVFTPDENDTFRAVHDIFGHAAARRGFDRHGEEAAYQRHARMYSPLASLAMATETRGQNAAMIAHGGEFQPERIAILPDHWRTSYALMPRSDRERQIAARQSARFQSHL